MAIFSLTAFRSICYLVALMHYIIIPDLNLSHCFNTENVLHLNVKSAHQNGLVVIKHLFSIYFGAEKTMHRDHKNTITPI